MTDARGRGVRRPGLILVLLAVVVAWWWLWFWYCRGETTVLLVRHAERADGQDQLSAAGLARAEELAHVAEKAQVAAVYHSDAQRTRQTALPLATRLGLTAIEIPGSDVRGLVDDVLARHHGQTVVVVGHSNTVPQIIAAFGGPSLPNIGENEFDNLFALSVCRCRPPKLVNMQYGALSPSP